MAREGKTILEGLLRPLGLFSRRPRKAPKFYAPFADQAPGSIRMPPMPEKRPSRLRLAVRAVRRLKCKVGRHAPAFDKSWKDSLGIARTRCRKCNVQMARDERRRWLVCGPEDAPAV